MTFVDQSGYVNAEVPVNGLDERPLISPTANELYEALAPFARFDGPQTNWALMSWCEALVGTTRLDDISRIVYDQPDGTPGWSSFLDVDECPTWALPWLAQMVGVRTLPGADVFAQRSQIRAHAGWNRGTPAAILSAASAHLTPGASVTLHERDTSPYHATLKLYSAQLSALTYAEINNLYPTIAAFRAAFPLYSNIPGSGALATAVQIVKPAGIQLQIVFLDHAAYEDIQAVFPTIAGFRAAFSTYAQVAAWLPPT